MSLINDALKRAKKAQSRSAPAPASEPPLQPVIHEAPPSSLRTKILTAAGLLTLAAACWLLLLAWRGSNQTARADRVHRKNPVASPTNNSALTLALNTKPNLSPTLSQPHRTNALSAPAGSKPPELASSNTLAMAQTTAPNPSEHSAIPASAHRSPTNEFPSEPPPPPPDLSAYRLQGIFYRSRRASALINSQTLFVGDEINKARVVLIEPDSVGLLLAGRTNLLHFR